MDLNEFYNKLNEKILGLSPHISVEELKDYFAYYLKKNNLKEKRCISVTLLGKKIKVEMFTKGVYISDVKSCENEKGGHLWGILYLQPEDDFEKKFKKIQLSFMLFEDAYENREKIGWWKREYIEIFLSYKAEELEKFKIVEFAEKLKKKTKIKEVYYWDKWRDVIGGNINDYMDEYIKKSDAVIAFFSKEYVNSEPCTREWNSAQEENVYLIPIFDKKENLPEDLNYMTWLEFSEHTLNDLIKKIHNQILER